MEKKRKLGAESDRKNVSPEKRIAYVKKLSQMISCRTVFHSDGRFQKEYEEFYSIIENSFPLLTERAERLTFGSGCFVYIIRGKNAKKSVMLMSHHDVVDGSDKWKTDPFCAEEKDGYLYGRGTIDTKTPLFAELQAAEELLEEGYDFRGITLYIGSSNNEETGGDGMVLAAQYFKEHGIFFDTVLDEGGAILSGQIPGVTAKSAMIAVHEKSRHMYKCTASLDENGHSGFGKSGDTPVMRMSKFIAEVSNAHIYKEKFYPEVAETFKLHAPYMSFPMNLLFGNLRLFSPVIKKVMAGMPPAAAMLATSISFQSIIGVDEEDPQTRAKNVESYMFMRCIREEDLYAGLKKIEKIAEKYGVTLTEESRDYCKPTSYKKQPFLILEEVLHENFPDVITAPFLLTAGTDARRLKDVADSILRFAPIDLTPEQFATVHSEDEHILIKNIGECVCFYKDFIQRISEGV